MPIHDWTRVDAGVFHHFHQAWITEIARALNAGILPAECYALAEQIAGGLLPDVLTLETSRPSSRPPAGGDSLASELQDGGIALATAPPKVRFTLTSEPERYARKQSRIAIRHKSGDRVVAVLEILSPGNKGSRYALRLFVEKTIEFLESGIHLVVVDLFPPGPRDPQGIHSAIWSEIEESEFQLPPDQPLTLASYSSGLLKRAFIEPVAVGTTLPDMPLFLEPDRYILTPLEPTYADAFAAVPKRWRDELEPSVD
jgi:hypothetical protein